MNNQEEWWYAVDGTRKGPVSIQALQGLFSNGVVNHRSLIWREGMENWVSLEEIGDFQRLATTTPPNLPRRSLLEELASLQAASPSRRFLARVIDLWIIALPTSFTVQLALSNISPTYSLWIQTPGAIYVLNWMLVPIILLIEARIFGVFGTTLGKALLGVEVITTGGTWLSTSQYLRRQLGVYWFGLGTGIPIVSAFSVLHQYYNLKSKSHTSYDFQKYCVKARKLSAIRLFWAAVTVPALVIVIGILQRII